MNTLNPEVLRMILGDRVDERTNQILELLTTDPEELQAGPEPELDNRRAVPEEARSRGGPEGDGLDAVQEELEELRHRNDVLAMALGACPNCWGEAQDCAECQGRGRPGSYELDIELYDAVVAPAVTAYAAARRPMVGHVGHHARTSQLGGPQP